MDFLNEKCEKTADNLGVAVVNLKKIEGIIPAGISSNDRKIVTAPLALPPTPSRSSMPTKPIFSQGKKITLESLLEDTPVKKTKAQIGAGMNNNKPTASANNNKSDNTDRRQFSIASALKALGYGES